MKLLKSSGNKRLVNVIMLGALLEMTPILPFDAVEEAVKNHLPERHKHLLALQIFSDGHPRML
jgi:Pyruvate/2-oxoacid:ferredoxin oxidoreductase gamma subunit